MRKKNPPPLTPKKWPCLRKNHKNYVFSTFKKKKNPTLKYVPPGLFWLTARQTLSDRLHVGYKFNLKVPLVDFNWRTFELIDKRTAQFILIDSQADTVWPLTCRLQVQPKISSDWLTLTDLRIDWQAHCSVYFDWQLGRHCPTVYMSVASST